MFNCIANLKMGYKIRILLLLLTLCFVATAITVHNRVGKQDLLELDAKTLTKNIHQKEDVINKLFSDTLLLKTLSNFERYPLQVRGYAKNYAKQSIHLYIYKNNKPVYWVSNVYVPETHSGLKNDINFIKSDNRSFIVRQKQIDGNITVLALLPVKRNFNTNNEYLKNSFFDWILKTENLEIAEFNDTGSIRNIYSKNKTYLFSVKLKPGKHNNIFIQIQFICWIFGTLLFTILMSNICYELAKKGRSWLSVLLFAAVIIGIRLVDLETNWLAQNSSLAIFDPKYYAYNKFFPHLWAFIINSISMLWFICYLISIKKFLTIPQSIIKTVRGTVVYYLLLSLLYLLFNAVFFQLNTLTTNTSVRNNDLTHLLDLNSITLVFTAIYCLNVLSLVVFSDLVLDLGKKIVEKTTTNLNIQLFVLVQAIIISALCEDLSLFNVIVALLIMIRSFDNHKIHESNFSSHIAALVLIALISTIKYTEAWKINQEEEMKLILANLEAEDDINAITLFSEIEDDILNDQKLKHLFTLGISAKEVSFIDEYIKRQYLSGYLSKYEFQGYYYLDNNSLGNYNKNKIDEYREKVISRSSRLNETEYFYKVASEIGTHEYFAQIALPISETQNALLFLNFKNKAFSPTIPYPVILTDNRLNFINQENINKDSFALYKNGSLITQNGKYTYPNTDKEYPKNENEFIKLNDSFGFHHMLYKPNSFTTIIVSKPFQSYWEFIAVVSLSFLILYISTTILKFFNSIYAVFSSKRFKFKNLKYQFRLLFSNIQYSTRIQTLVVASVLFAIIISGIITFFSISYQSENNKKNDRLNYISEVSKRIENTISYSNTVPLDRLESILQYLTDILVTDFNLYNKNGKLIYSTQPKIYDQKLLSEYINQDAYIDLNVLKKTETLHTERIANFVYSATYSTIRNSEYQTIAYLSVPYYAAKKEDTSNQNIILNTILNIYTIIIIAFAFFSAFISNKITAPLNIISKKLSQTNLSGKPNEPLYWEKNDEIGALIKEYNYMLIKLEENAKQLRNAEREITWREMAKQIAHEIKNPLTPMKLGIQQLSRSFYEKDPKLEERFERISTSFIEQIDALSRIASEFSAFAKLPETKLVEINLIEKISKSIDLYNNNHNTVIQLANNTNLKSITVLGDRNQLLRSFNNLIKNAIEASPTKRKHRIAILINPMPDYWIEVQVKDNGLGIADDALPNIFRPNFTTKSSGTGLGLAFVKQTIDGMGGSIKFETELNIGTTFYIQLPLINEPEDL
ncbi:ATP-binding protein [Sphingobacterium lumbrici]|uniref:ATP-binding protein n=1 Tax=Sphingobacterium lumbrici TaxID=2559600 RepID=UPI001C121239|nr:ATP-binding protein [Sphingobacterium lumbrici]